MSPEFKALMARERFHRAAFVEAMTLLPADDAELDRWVEAAVASSESGTFLWLVVAALGAERPVDARHLARGAQLCMNQHLLGAIAWRMKGETAAHLLDAARNTTMTAELTGAALLAAALWCKERREGRWLEELIPTMRTLARLHKEDADVLVFIHAAAWVTQDEGLRTLLAGQREVPPDENLAGVCDSFLTVCRVPVLELVAEKADPALAAGLTMRRSVAKVGRNEPCPCGSGRKYKHCCVEQDRERLHNSTPVAGCSLQQFWANPEQHVTRQLLEQAAASDLARLDAAKLAPDLRELFIRRLAKMSLLDRATEVFEKLGCPEEWREAWRRTAMQATFKRRGDLLQRLAAVRADKENLEQDLPVPSRLLLEEADPAAWLEWLESTALKTLQTEDTETQALFAIGFLLSQHPALGIFVARGMIPMLPKKHASFVFERLLDARDRLKLPPDDPFGDVMDQRFFDHDEETLREAKQKLERKAKEVRQLKESLDALQRQMERREKASAEASPVAAIAAAAPDEAALREMREKVGKLRDALKERHEERNELRRELQQAHSVLEALRQNSPAPSAQEQEEADVEESLLLPAEEEGTQPVRTIEFPKGFQEKLSSLPRAVARGTMSALGRIAAGEPAAFAGAVRLKACPSVTRMRMGIDFRLLFRLLPDCVQVVDLIPRQDLERRIKTLLKSAIAA